MANLTEKKYFLLTHNEIKEIRAIIEFAMEAGYTDVLAKLAEDVGALAGVDAILCVAERSQYERIQTVKEV